MDEVYKWRAPRGTKILPVVTGGKLDLFPNGKPMYNFFEKPKKRN